MLHCVFPILTNCKVVGIFETMQRLVGNFLSQRVRSTPAWSIQLCSILLLFSPSKLLHGDGALLVEQRHAEDEIEMMRVRLTSKCRFVCCKNCLVL